VPDRPGHVHRHRFPTQIIAHAVWLYHRFALSFRDVEELLFERGIVVSYESIRAWVTKFGDRFAAGLRRRERRPGRTWHLDEVFERNTPPILCILLIAVSLMGSATIPAVAFGQRHANPCTVESVAYALVNAFESNYILVDGAVAGGRELRRLLSEKQLDMAGRDRLAEQLTAALVRV
jgi:hypothetical protein